MKKSGIVQCLCMELGGLKNSFTNDSSHAVFILIPITSLLLKESHSCLLTSYIRPLCFNGYRQTHSISFIPMHSTVMITYEQEYNLTIWFIEDS